MPIITLISASPRTTMGVSSRWCRRLTDRTLQQVLSRSAVHGSAVAPDFVARHFLVDRPRPELKSMNSPLRYTMSLARLSV